MRIIASHWSHPANCECWRCVGPALEGMGIKRQTEKKNKTARRRLRNNNLSKGKSLCKTK